MSFCSKTYTQKTRSKVAVSLYYQQRHGTKTYACFPSSWTRVPLWRRNLSAIARTQIVAEALEQAVKYGSSENARFLFQHFAHMLDLSRSLLHAISDEFEALVRDLVEHGADINPPGDIWNTPLAVALREDAVNVFKIFCKEGSKVL